ncbi:MAG: hypothetical protein E7294_15145 [Lachnospiraceae bacterium]|nr:hypothetical protein [Lachnospiraceae bacterium]
MLRKVAGRGNRKGKVIGKRDGMSKKRKHSQKRSGARTGVQAQNIKQKKMHEKEVPGGAPEEELSETAIGERSEELRTNPEEERNEELQTDPDEEEAEDIISPEAGQSEETLARKKEQKTPETSEKMEPESEDGEEEEGIPSPEAGQSEVDRDKKSKAGKTGRTADLKVAWDGSEEEDERTDDPETAEPDEEEDAWESEYDEEQGEGGQKETITNSKGAYITLAFLAILLLGGSIVAAVILSKPIYPANPLYGGTEAEHDWQGDRVYLGNYEQDNVTDNGKEPVLWRVLSIDEEKMLLLSEYALDVRRYHEVNEEVTWETCEVRKWLNGEFAEDVFADREKWQKSYLIETKCKTAANQRFGTDGGKDTKDLVFLPAWEDTYQESYGFPKAFERKSDITNQPMEYGEVCRARVCYPTMYTLGKDPLVTRYHDVHVDPFGQGIDGFGSVHWLLRTPGADQTYGTNVSRWGRTTYNFFSPVDHDESAVRPMVWVDITQLRFGRLKNGYYYVKEDRDYKKECEAGLDYQSEVSRVLSNEPIRETPAYMATEKTKIDQLEDPVRGGNATGDWEGDRVYFGSYQDEPVLWRVLSTNDGKLMLLSEYGLVERHFDKASKEVTWAKSAVRKWLNEKLLPELFTESQQAAVMETELKNPPNPRYGTDSGEDTADRMFLLSWDDCINEAYGFMKGEGKENAPTESNTRICYERWPDNEKAIYGKSDRNGNRIWSNWQIAANWMLRTAGSRDGYISDVNIYGDIYRHEKRKASKKMWVRPALVLQKDMLSLEKKDGEDFPTIVVGEGARDQCHSTNESAEDKSVG